MGNWRLDLFPELIDKNGISQSAADLRYLKLDTSNDPLTGELVITPVDGTNALKANMNITLKAGQKLIFDGA
jgi:hypothetical protein